MKVALLIFPLHYSHGCILQTYALYSLLKANSFEVTIIDRQPDRYGFWGNVFIVIKRLLKKIIGKYKGPIFYVGYYPKAIMSELQSFIDTFSHDIISVYSTDEIQKCINWSEYGAIIVGSDQTWRPRYVPNIMDYWLDFLRANSNIVKIAYAPSFGVDNWEYNDSQTNKCRRLAKSFNGVSVRELGGCGLCKKYLNVDAEHVVDPTMLWNADYYLKFLKNTPIEQDICSCYFLDKTSEKVEVTEIISKRMGLHIDNINTETEDDNAPLENRIAPSIDRWLMGFVKSKFILVDSYHAMVFSIIFNKPFIVIGNINRGLSRFESLLSEVGLLNRLILNISDLDKAIESSIDWNKVNEIISVHREKSIIFLMNLLKKSLVSR